MPVSLPTIRLVYTQVFCFSLFYKGHFKLHHCSLQSNSDVQTFCTTASAERNTWLQFNLKLADRVVLSKELHLSVESIEAERRLQARESSPCPRNNMVVVRDRENLSNVLSSQFEYKFLATPCSSWQCTSQVSPPLSRSSLTAAAGCAALLTAMQNCLCFMPN